MFEKVRKCQFHLDVSLTATRLARARIAKACRGAIDVAGAGRATLVHCDYFQYSPHVPLIKFDLILDHGFCCAVPPERLVDYARQAAFLLKKGGQLVVLLHPVGNANRSAASVSRGHYGPGSCGGFGPPFAVEPFLLSSLLEEEGFDRLALGPVPRELSVPHRAGREWLGRWRRVRSPLVKRQQGR